jgi:hypothetical protein
MGRVCQVPLLKLVNKKIVRQEQLAGFVRQGVLSQEEVDAIAQP